MAMTEEQWREIQELVRGSDEVPKRCFTCDRYVDGACGSEVLNAYRTEQFKPAPTWYCAEWVRPEGLLRVSLPPG